MQARVAAMAEQDPEFKRFGAKDHGYRLHPPLAEKAVRSFEREHGVRLPESYRGFLTDVADGGAGPHYGLFRLTDRLAEEDAVYDLREEGRTPGFLATPFPYAQACPGPGRAGSADYSVSGTLVIAEAGSGEFHRLVVTGRSAGQVWSDDPGWGGLTLGPDFHRWYTAWLESTS
ncbi:SMI1/KNR4 family protein [Kitasatospora sp. NPDC098663]|uniref:SMI1/KNR4 family protein n=1 Tax=Kitasatospora sp. NPDC098663 TaxID=3364096 RepID=UPI00381CF3EB